MPRDSFQQELDNLVAGMLDLGRQVEASLENMVGAMERRESRRLCTRRCRTWAWPRSLTSSTPRTRCSLSRGSHCPCRVNPRPHVDEGVKDAIDAAYCTKYHRYADSYVTHMIRPEARATTIKLIPR